MSRPLPDDPFLRGPWEPWPMEGQIDDVLVEGALPPELVGTLYRNGPNQRYAPIGAYHPFIGDGMIHAFHFDGRRVRYRNRWVRTPRFLRESEHGEGLFAGFDPFAKDPRAKGVPGGPANTNVVWHAGRLLALVEGGLPPVELDPVTLETRGLWNFDGRLRKPIAPEAAEALGIDAPDGLVDAEFTAHPKLDPESGEMLGFAYDVMPPWLVYHEVDAAGRLARSVPITTPFPAMVHDFVTTRGHVVFPIFPATLRIERAIAGENLIGWEPELGTHVGVMPRKGGDADVTWLRCDPCFVFHPLNAYDDGRRVIADMAQYPRLPIPAAGDPGWSVNQPATLVRWHIDLDAGTVKQEALDDLPIEFPRLDERRTGLPYRHGYAAGLDGALAGARRLVHYDLATGACERHELGAGDAVGEPIFVPRTPDAPEGDGWLLAVVYRGAEHRSDLLVLDAERLAAGPVATLKLPHRVPAGFHGNWRPGPL